MSRRILAAVGLAVVLGSLAGCERARSTEDRTDRRAACVAACAKVASAESVDPGLCDKACSRTCADKCEDLATRTGGFVPCQEVCSRSCADLEATYGMSHDLCTYLVENRFDPTYVTAPDRPARPR
jgi:hypothetical protein